MKKLSNSNFVEALAAAQAAVAQAGPPTFPARIDPVVQDPPQTAEPVDDFEEGEEIEEYNQYKSNYDRGADHPDILIQSSAMANVKPPPITYELSLRPKVFKNNLLSRPQLETIAYACQAHDLLLPNQTHRKGFFLGDGAGVGKGTSPLLLFSGVAMFY